jgi:HK97 family phage portal protein
MQNFLSSIVGAIKARAAQTFSVFVPIHMEGQPVYSERKFRTYVQEGYRVNELIFACIELTANTAASCRLQVLNKGDDDPVEDHELRRLLERPNPWTTEFDFWVTTLVSLKLAGASYWFKARGMGGRGKPTQLWPLRPDLIAPIPGSNPDRIIEEWEYLPEGGGPIRLDANDVLAFRKSDPLDFFKTVSPMGVLAKSADVDNAITNYLKKFFDRGAMPAGALKSKLKLSPLAITDLMNSWERRYGGAENWHKPVILDSDASYERTGLTFEEMNFSELDMRNELRICMALGVPPILVGARAGLERSTFSNYAEARKAWWEDHLMPLYKFLSDTIDLQLAPEYGDEVDTEWDFSEVPALHESRDSQFTRATAGVAGGWFTVNAALREVQEEEVGPAGDVFLRTAGQVPVPMNETVEEQRARAAEEQEAAIERLQASKPGEDKPPEEGGEEEESAEEDEKKPPALPQKSASAEDQEPPEEGEDVPPPDEEEQERLFALYEELISERV